MATFSEVSILGRPVNSNRLPWKGALVTESTSPPQPPPDFLNQVGLSLARSEDVDKDLAAILVDHLLTEKPKANAVADAKKAIEALAAARAVALQAKTDPAVAE